MSPHPHGLHGLTMDPHPKITLGLEPLCLRSNLQMLNERWMLDQSVVVCVYFLLPGDENLLLLPQLQHWQDELTRVGSTCASLQA